MTNGNNKYGVVSKRRVAFRSIGCRTNQEEMFALKAKLSLSGSETVEDIKNADVVVVNTCSVTSYTESKTGRFIRSILRDAPNARILVTGCFAERHGATLLKIPGVVRVVGNGGKHLIPSIVSDMFNSTGLLAAKNEAYLPNVSASEDVFWEDCVLGPLESGRTRFSVKIQEGCDFKCAYCVVPSLRGRSRSAPKDQLISMFKKAVEMGYKEIVLTGTHIGQYRGESSVYGLESLLEDFLKIEGDYRIRLSSLDPRDISNSLLSMVGVEKRVCDHLHVSVQSLCADVLSRMGRPYGHIDSLVERLRGFRESYPYAGLGADIIVGHPGETSAMFEETLRCVESIGFTYGHVFRYSKRMGTPSALMPGTIGEFEKKTRSERLRKTLSENRKNFLSLLFTARPIYIITEAENPVRGVSGNYIKVLVPNVCVPKNSWMRVIITEEASGGYCVAKEICDAGKL